MFSLQQMLCVLAWFFGICSGILWRRPCAVKTLRLHWKIFLHLCCTFYQHLFLHRIEFCPRSETVLWIVPMHFSSPQLVWLLSQAFKPIYQRQTLSLKILQAACCHGVGRPFKRLLYLSNIKWSCLRLSCKKMERLYLDMPIPQIHFMKLNSCSLYNSWHTLKREGSAELGNKKRENSVSVSKIPPGHYTLAWQK